MENNIEILAPAGGYGTFVSAVNNGADAVYIGGKSFSADAEFMAGRFAAPKLYAVSYTSNETSCRASSCYGYVTDGSVKFYLVPDFFNISKIPRKTEAQTVSRRPEVSQRPLPPPPGELQKIIMLLEKISVKEDVILSDLKKCLDNIKKE